MDVVVCASCRTFLAVLDGAHPSRLSVLHRGHGFLMHLSCI
ncbi:hypothetical protein [Streptomyces sp. NPDC008141]